ncbi:MAG: hypothetical protein JWP58_3867 [Hymenobacter sp.]|nr:hypothetical protein [Hymenobacter sp.]
MNNFTLRYLLLGVSLSPVLLPAAAQAQIPAASNNGAGTAATGTSSSLTGQVTSAQGQVQPNTSVSIISLATSQRRTVQAGPTGTFTIPGLVPGGPYVVQVQQPGFRVQNITNVFLKAGEATVLTVTLNPETVAVGTRRSDRTALESAVPVDVVEMSELVRTVPQTDLTQLLQYSVAAFNSTRQTGAGGSDHVDPASLRGLGTDQMLVLVNGKRRHTTALVNLLSNRGLGSVGTDLNTLSSLGVERVEVLRDGAAAQYGSDAIAGVMNINLKSDNHGGSVLLSSGVTSEGDGLATLLGVNKGFRLGQKGFLNLTADADYRGRTTRGYARDPLVTPVFVANNPAAEQAALAAAGKTYKDFEQHNGDARVRNVRGLFNARVEVSEALAFYGFGSYNFRRGQANTPWVLPATQPNDVIKELFPYGYQPEVNTRIHDAAGTVGVVLGRSGPNHWTLDLSNTTGYNRMNYDLANTLNASLGSESPTVFDNAGGFQFLQNVTNATANRFFDKVLAGTNVALGGEFRADRYEILRGDVRAEAEYDNNSLGKQGAQGFSGFGEASVVVGNRTNVGAFLDVEADITKHWSVSGALRYENYSTFGSAFIYKATTRVQATKFLALRGAFNTGFRAPSLQQVLYRQITQRPGVDGVTYDGIFNNQNPLRVAVGVPELFAEKSINYSAGLVLTPTSAFSLTADVYQIDINDRITLSGLLRKESFGINAKLTQDFTNTRVDAARFFTNDLDTRTQGLDLVANYRHALSKGQLAVTAAANFNQTRTRAQNVPANFSNLETDDNPTTNYIDPRQLSLIETGNPASKILLGVNYNLGKFGVGLRNTYFGEVKYYDVAPDPKFGFGGYLLVFNPRTVTDLLVSYQPAKALTLTAGAQNLFNVKPNTIDEAASNGVAPGGFTSRSDFERYFQNRFGVPSPFPANRDIYPYAPVQMGFNGAFLYLKAVYNFGI